MKAAACGPSSETFQWTKHPPAALRSVILCLHQLAGQEALRWGAPDLLVRRKVERFVAENCLQTVDVDSRCNHAFL